MIGRRLLIKHKPLLSPFITKRTMKIQNVTMRWGRGDNYAYILTDDATKQSLVIDPAEPDEVLPVLKQLELAGKIKLSAIVNTHHHYDHAGGNEALSKAYPKLPIIAGKDSPLVTQTPAHNSTFSLGDNILITALHTPCHTQDSICYFAEDKVTGQRAVFTGDTLFIAGCGRFFEGNAKEMDAALNKVLGSLPDDTVVYPGHEYTKSNVKFVETEMNRANYPAVKKLAEFAEQNEFTTGVFTIKDEKEYNPFMRLTDPALQNVVGLSERNEVMAKLRELKNKM